MCVSKGISRKIASKYGALLRKPPLKISLHKGFYLSAKMYTYVYTYMYTYVYTYIHMYICTPYLSADGFNKLRDRLKILEKHPAAHNIWEKFSKLAHKKKKNPITLSHKSALWPSCEEI